MRVVESALNGVKLLHTRSFEDARGWFAEVWSAQGSAAVGLPTHFVQDNQSFSRKGVLRGLHFQVGRPQDKLIRVLHGEIWDVAVDVRRDSTHFGQWQAFSLRPRTDTGEIPMLWIPKGFAHGFLVLSDEAEVLYKVTDIYFPAGERTIRWDDAELAIPWPLGSLGDLPVQVSDKDRQGLALRDAELPNTEPASPAKP